MPRPTFSRALCPLLVVALLAGACGGGGDQGDGSADTGAGSAAGSDATSGDAGSGDAAAGRPFAFTEADLDLYERGLTKEIELVRAAQERASSGTTPAARSEAMQAQWKEQTMPEAARAIGVAPERYQQVRESVHQVLETLDFQGKIEGPMQMDTARATPQMRARLASDPLAELPGASAAALRARLDRLAPLFARYVSLTAVGG